MNLYSFKSGSRIRIVEKPSQGTGQGEEWLVTFKKADGQLILDEKGNPIVEEVRAIFVDGRMTTAHLQPITVSNEIAEADTLIAA